MTHDSLTLDDQHVYRYGGRVVPGVTQCLGIISDMSFIDPARLEAARDFGANVHLMTDLFDKGDLDEDELDPELVPYLKAYKQFLRETGFVVTHSEAQVYHRTLGYAGTLDKRGVLRKATALIDIKSGVFFPGYCGAQTWAYREALEEKPQRRYCLQLMRNVYRLHPLNDPADGPIFLSALNIFRFIHKRKLTHEPARHFTE